MKFLKNLFLLIVVIIVVALIAALFIKKDYAVEREIVINKSLPEVFNYIRYIKNQDNYSVWNQRDPAMKKTYRGTDGSVGFVYGWESANKHVGVGEQELVKIDEGKRLDMKLRFKVPFEAEDDAYMETIPVDSAQTKVKWGFTGAFPYPMNLMKLFFNMEKEIGGDLESGLVNLKQVMEKQ